MKKRLLIIILFILFIPTLVKAEENVTVKSIELLGKSDDTEILEQANYTDGKLNFNVKLYHIDDYASYKIVVVNNSDKTLYFDEAGLLSTNDYTSYELKYSNGKSFIKPNEEKTVELKIIYKQEAPKELFRSAVYDASADTILNLTDHIIGIANTLKNLGIVGILLYLLVFISLFVGVGLLIKNKKKSELSLLVLILLLIFIPKNVMADYTISIPIKAKVLIGKVLPKPCTYEGELTPGTEYVNGQYTYKYKFKGNGDNWVSMTDDGWGVVLTDKTSEEDVTTELCSFINDKPVVAMSFMFYSSSAQNIDLSSFDTSNVNDMSYMFLSTSNVTELDFSSFDTSKVTTFNYMFCSSKVKVIDLRYFDTSSLMYTSYMFAGAYAEEINLSNFILSSITNASSTFTGNSYLKRLILDGWDLTFYNTGTGSLLYGIISSGSGMNLDFLSLKNWIIPERFNYMNTGLGIQYTNAKTIDVTDWDLSGAKEIGSFFRDNKQLKNVIGLDTWDTSNITSMYALFEDCAALEELVIDNWDTSNVTDFSYLVTRTYNMKKLVLKNLDLKKVTGSLYEFGDYIGRDATSLEIDVENVDISNATGSLSLFQYAGNNSETVDITIKNFLGNKFTSSNYVFGYIGRQAKNVSFEVDNLNLSSTQGSSGLFRDIGYNADETNVTIKNVNLSSSSTADSIFSYIGYNAKKLTLDIEDIDLRSATNVQWFLTDTGEYSEEIDIKVNNLDIRSATSIANSINYIGYRAINTKIVMTNVNAESATTSESAFVATGQCGGSTSEVEQKVYVKLENWNLKSVESAGSMFENVGKTCDETTLIMKNINFTSLKSTWYMFHKFSSYSDISKVEFENITAPNIEHMNYMFIYSGQYANTWEIKGLNQFISDKTTNFYQTFEYTRFQGNATRDYGTLDIYGGNLGSMFMHNDKMKVVLNLHGNVTGFSTEYGGAFYSAATSEDSEVIINYTSDVDIDTLMANVASNPNIKKGSLIDN